MRRIRTTTIAKWPTQRVGKKRLALINQARDLIAKQQRGGDPAPVWMNVPDDIAPSPRAGRPRVMPPDAESVSVSLTAAHIATARRLGDGNVSAGVRKALEDAK